MYWWMEGRRPRMEWATVRRSVTRSNPARLARIPVHQRRDWTPRNAPKQPWSIEELRRFLAAAAEDRLAVLWMVYVTTGLERGEALALRWDDVDLDAGTAHMRRNRTCTQGPEGRIVYDDDAPKTSSSVRTVTLDAATVAALRAHRAAQLEERLAAGTVWTDEVGRVFSREDGIGLDPDGISMAFRQLCASAEVRTIRLHDVRHLHATLMLAGGVPVEVISKRLGHSRISTTMDLYVHPSDEQQRSAADVFGRLVAGSEG